jgi:ABC-type spermidine/putrescine transport system permease subunit II
VLRPANVVWSAVVCAVVAFLFAPIVTTVIFSFNQGSSGRQTDSFTGFTTSWFGVAAANSTARSSLTTSLIVAISSASLAVLFGTVTGYTLARPKRRLASGVLAVLAYLLLIVPEIVLAVSLLLLYDRTGIPLGLGPLIAAHTPFSTAVIAVIVRSRVLTLDRALEDAAGDLGAGGLRSFVDVQLPLLLPAILLGMVLAFTFSFDDLVISLFLTTPSVETLPVYLWSTVHTGVRPDVYAIATLMLAFTLTVITGGSLLYRWQLRRIGGERSGVRALAASAAG